MYKAEGPWGTPEVEELFQSHMAAYHRAGIIDAYNDATQFWKDIFTDRFGLEAIGHIQEARRAEHYLFPSYTHDYYNLSQLQVHKVDSATGIILPSSTVRAAVITGETGVQPYKAFGQSGLYTLLDARTDFDDYGLKAIDVSGQKQY